jgi:hypothetical protein
MLNVIMLNVANSPFLLSVLKLNVIMLSVVAPPLLYTANLPYYLVKQSCVLRFWAKIGKLANGKGYFPFTIFYQLPLTDSYYSNRPSIGEYFQSTIIGALVVGV